MKSAQERARHLLARNRQRRENLRANLLERSTREVMPQDPDQTFQ
ncbi:hypothetical protein [Nodosilinea sp. P-1105]|nr:hypothetical protein [Nodosilinea sp. P-1105]